MNSRKTKKAKPQGARDKAVADVLRVAADENVGFLRLWFTDVLGFLKSFAIPAEELERAFSSGVTFDGSAIQGFSRGREADLIATPDPFTFQMLPWYSDGNTAAMFCDISTPTRRPYEEDSRAVLRRQIDALAELGYVPYIGPEIEFFLLRDDKSVELLDSGTYFDETPTDVSSGFRSKVIRYLETMGIPVEEVHHEVAPSQHEIDLRFADALTMADSIMSARLAIKEAASEFGIYATFMPKPQQGAWGSGMHLHLTLLTSEGKSVSSSNEMSPVERSFVAGILKHARAITAVTNQWVNSYKRLIPGFEAPIYVSWGRTNYSSLIRIPTSREGATKIEIRSPDPACNPYLAFALILAAGRDGIETGAELGGELTSDPHEMSPGERRALGIKSLPDNLALAIAELESSPLVRDVLGVHVLEWIVRNKRDEWETYRRQVSDFELREYLTIL